MTLRHATSCQVHSLSITPIAEPEGCQVPRSTWTALRCRGDLHLDTMLHDGSHLCADRSLACNWGAVPWHFAKTGLMVSEAGKTENPQGKQRQWVDCREGTIPILYVIIVVY